MKKSLSYSISLSLLLSGIACVQSVFANPADYIYTPVVEYGERELDIKFGTSTEQAGIGNSSGASLGYGYGAMEYWFTEVYVKHESSGSSGANLAEWENKFQFTDIGKYPVDAGFITEVEAPLSAKAPWELKFGPLFQTESGKVQWNGNLLFERPFGKADENGVPYITNFSYQWQAKYRWQPELEFGLQGFGALGKWDNWNKQIDQSHSFGPAAFGKLALGNRKAIRYNTAWLHGTGNAAAEHTFRLQVEYEF